MPEEVEVQLASKNDPARGGASRPPFRTAHAPGISWLIVILLMVLLAFAVINFGNRQPAVSLTPAAISNDSTAPTAEQTLGARAAIANGLWVTLASVSIRTALGSSPGFSYEDFASVLAKISDRL